MVALFLAHYIYGPSPKTNLAGRLDRHIIHLFLNMVVNILCSSWETGNKSYFVEENLIGIFKYWRENKPGQMIQTFSKNEEIYIILKKKPTKWNQLISIFL